LQAHCQSPASQAQTKTCQRAYKASPKKEEEGNPDPHCSTFPSPHKPTPKPKACKRAAILPAHQCLIVTFER